MRTTEVLEWVTQPLRTNAGELAARGWLGAIAVIAPRGRWHAEVTLEALDRPRPLELDAGTSLRIDVASDEWGFVFCHAGRRSWIRVTDVPFAHGRDEHGLLGMTPPLRDIARLIARLERKHALRFDRMHARVRTSLDGAESAIARWALSL